MECAIEFHEVQDPIKPIMLWLPPLDGLVHHYIFKVLFANYPSFVVVDTLRLTEVCWISALFLLLLLYLQSVLVYYLTTKHLFL
jgi:hypothetical protein